jgi:hypothetical protein
MLRARRGRNRTDVHHGLGLPLLPQMEDGLRDGAHQTTGQENHAT